LGVRIASRHVSGGRSHDAQHTVTMARKAARRSAPVWMRVGLELKDTSAI